MATQILITSLLAVGMRPLVELTISGNIMKYAVLHKGFGWTKHGPFWTFGSPKQAGRSLLAICGQTRPLPLGLPCFSPPFYDTLSRIPITDQRNVADLGDSDMLIHTGLTRRWDQQDPRPQVSKRLV
jgi:hypothetical protein